MIKFFRKVRQQLLSENKFSKYLLYALGEIVLIVAGVLIALQLSEWKENIKLDGERNVYYEQILEDLKKDAIYIKKYITEMDSIKIDYNKYLTTFDEPDLTAEQVIANLLKLNHSAKVLAFNTSTIESLENTGDIKLVPPTIRNKLIDLKRSQDLIIEVSVGNNQDQTQILQIFSLEMGSYDLASRLNNQEKLSEILNLEGNNQKIIMALEASMSWKLSSSNTNTLIEVLEENEALTALINVELGN